MASYRTSPAGIKDILDDMSSILPDHRSERPDKKACLRTYGLLINLFNKAATSATPTAEYNEMLKIEVTLRQRLATLGSNGIPLKMQGFMDELRSALTEVISFGDERLRMMYAEDQKDKETPNEVGSAISLMTKKEPPVRMVPITKVQEVRMQLKAEREKVRKLNEENNRLTIEIKMLKASSRLRC